MTTLWNSFFAFSRPLRWTVNFLNWRSFAFLPQFRILERPHFCDLTAKRLAYYKNEYAKTEKNLGKGPGIFKTLEKLARANYADPFWRRDAIDIARTVLDQSLRWTFVKLALNLDAWRKDKTMADTIRIQRQQVETLLALLGDLLDQSPDFSIYASFQRLAKTAPLNPHTEQTLKGNIENSYCRTFASELVRHVYAPEYEVYFNWIEKRLAAGGRKPWRRPAEEFEAARKRIQEEFYATPLKDMVPRAPRSAECLEKIFRQCGKTIEITMSVCHSRENGNLG